MMSKFNDLLNLRFKQKESNQPKMAALVERSNNGDLSSFSGVFRVSPLTVTEEEELETILKHFRHSTQSDVESDLKVLSTLTSEVKAITNQAIMLHGERIKKAQEVLKKYRDGAFTSWLFATYRNRQTPYNFLQYYEFCTLMPPALHTKIDQMPRQVVYTLAARSGEWERKKEIVEAYKGQTKQELLLLIRKLFPLEETDRRAPNYAHHVILFLKRAKEALKNSHCTPDEGQRRQITTLLAQILTLSEKETLSTRGGKAAP